MSSDMNDVKQLVSHLPDDASIEDVQYHLYVLEKSAKDVAILVMVVTTRQKKQRNA